MFFEDPETHGGFGITFTKVIMLSVNEEKPSEMDISEYDELHNYT